MKTSTTGSGRLAVPANLSAAEGDPKKSINVELWQACAGAPVNLPAAGTHVVYFPQGHSEQVQEQSSAKVQILDSLAAETRSQMDVLASGLSDDVVSNPSNLEVPLVDGTIVPRSATDEVLLIENMEQLNSKPIDTSLSYNPSPATEDPDLGRSSSQIVELGRTDALSYESCSPSRGNLDMHQSSSPVEVLASDLSDNVISIPSNLQAPVAEGTETPSSSKKGAPETENSVQLLFVLVNASLSHNTSPAEMWTQYLNNQSQT